MPTLDLDAKRAARREAGAEALTVTVGGDEFTLPVELPIDLADGFKAAQDGDPTGIILVVEALFGEEQTERFMTHRPSLEDVGEILEAYGMSLGESSASPESSRSDSGS